MTSSEGFGERIEVVEGMETVPIPWSEISKFYYHLQHLLKLNYQNAPMKSLFLRQRESCKKKKLLIIKAYSCIRLNIYVYTGPSGEVKWRFKRRWCFQSACRSTAHNKKVTVPCIIFSWRFLTDLNSTPCIFKHMITNWKITKSKQIIKYSFVFTSRISFKL